MTKTSHAYGTVEVPSAADDGLGPIPFENTLLRQKIVATLRRAIEIGSLKAGERLVEKDLCLRLGVSRTSLREALRDLEANGVVTKVTARELVITPLSPEDADNLYSVRGAIEKLVAQQFIERANQHDVDALKGALARIRQVEDSGETALEARRDYYRLWCAGADNNYAFEYLMNIQLRLSVISSTKLKKPALIAQDIAEKQIILDHIEKRDLPAALEAICVHVSNAKAAARAQQAAGPAA
ncbi:GntR family transcriptional regulator [Novosphingobium sp. KN65.2]|uniref:GntR family transcriptional regulator n=1 Tax=Novosphingobium sp. KN65.2 TaxID=1478134 RepID=UPI0005EA478A|nr:GntR family transcriptional regulator [Novosphingobium sp. KN65.2]CDO35246.1 putative GntR family transcriptional regulator [Novosphingobium sp. KN65.2]